MKRNMHVRLISAVFILALLAGCSGSKKYFKAAERLEQQGLVEDAAEYYLEALRRKSTNVEAKIKLREVGQKHVSNLSSEFFRNYNTQQTEASLATFERLKQFNEKSAALGVTLDYPKSYEEDYRQAVETYCSTNYHQAQLLVNQKKYYEAQDYIRKVEKYNTNYKNLRQLEIVATCEPLYQNAINNLESKNYPMALEFLEKIKVKDQTYKDLPDLYELASTQQSKSFILFEPKPSTGREKDIETYLYSNFTEMAMQKLGSIKVLNNTPFQNAPASTDLYASTNIDLVQAIRKATGADFFYVFDITSIKEQNLNPTRTRSRGFQEVVTRVNDTTTITEYKPFEYNQVKASRVFSYEFRYKIINAYTNQIVTSQNPTVSKADAVEFQEFVRAFNGNINTLFPYNPQNTAPALRYNPRNWRNQFSARNDLKSFEELKREALDQTLTMFINSASGMR